MRIGEALALDVGDLDPTQHLLIIRRGKFGKTRVLPLRESTTPHVVRHTTAMHLLRSGVDITTIAAWLGHADLSTTHAYVQIDLRMKQQALT